MHITVAYQGQPLQQAKIYYKKGTVSPNTMTLAQYDGMLTADENGMATFTELDPGPYYFYAIGLASGVGKTLQGDITMTVLARSRAESNYYRLIEAK